MQLFDALPLGDIRVTADGYLVADVKAARVGIQLYSGKEAGRPEMATVRVYRPEAEVFKDEAMASFTTVPVTLDHPPVMVSSKNWRKYAVGFTSESVARDGGFIRVPLAVKDAAAIEAINAGKRELSCGYTCDLEFQSGKTSDGEEYDAIQTNIRGNHLAIVRAGRAGSECRIGDEAHNHHGEHQMTLKTVTVDGIPVEVTDQGATVIATLQKRIDDAKTSTATLVADHATAVAKLNTDHAAVVAAKDKELGTKDAEIEKLKANQMDDAKLDTLVAQRAEVVGKSRTIVDGVDIAGKSVVDIRRATVAKKNGEAKVKDKSDDYVEALFDAMADDAKKSGRDIVRDTIRSGVVSSASAHEVKDAAYSAMVDGYTNAWKTGGLTQKGAN